MSVSAAQMTRELEDLTPVRARRRGGLEVVPDPGYSAVGSTATSVDKALAVLEAFRGPGTVLGVTEIARRSNLSKSTTHRVLRLLVERGYLERAGVGYLLGASLFELGNRTAYTGSRSLRSVAMPHMIELLPLATAVHLAVPVDDEVMVLERVFGHRGLGIAPEVGCRLAADGSAPGDVIRAFSRAIPRSNDDARLLEQVRRRRLAQREWSVGTAALCLSAPVVAASSSEVVAALSLIVPGVDRCWTAGPELQLQRCAAMIGKRV